MRIRDRADVFSDHGSLGANLTVQLPATGKFLHSNPC